LRDIRSILALEPVRIEVDGCEVVITRPTIADLVDAIEINRSTPEIGKYWQMARHVLHPDGTRLFASVEEAARCPAHIGAAICLRIDSLYNEGRD
jgi:hypothetical protein